MKTTECTIDTLARGLTLEAGDNASAPSNTADVVIDSDEDDIVIMCSTGQEVCFSVNVDALKTDEIINELNDYIRRR